MMLSFTTSAATVHKCFARLPLFDSHATRYMCSSLFLFLLAGCSAIPTQVLNKSAFLPAHYTSDPLQTNPKPNDAALVSWWERLEDPVLNDFVKQVLDVNDDLAIALARLEQSRAIEKKDRLDQLPTFNIGGSVTRQRSSLKDPQNIAAQKLPGFSRDSTTFRADSNFSWELDLFGRKDVLKNASGARARASQADANAVRLSVVAEVARNTIIARTLQTRIRLALEAANTETELATITRAKLRGGLVSEADVLRAFSIEQDSLANAAGLESDYADTCKTIAILIADTPQFVRTKMATPGLPKLVVDIPDSGLPSDLLRRRTDIQRAEFQLDAASQDVAAFNADRFPKLNLGATLAFVAGAVSGLGAADALLASTAPSVSWRALDFGRLDADISRAKGVQKEALFRYRQTVTIAFAEADTALEDLQRRATTHRLAEASVDAQRGAWELVRLQYERGVLDFTTALETKRNLTRSEDLAVIATQSQLLAGVTAYRALGGGWEP
jgi:NodT family efflux transporter outer membrane factor (OMF) lipoprotein